MATKNKRNQNTNLDETSYEPELETKEEMMDTEPKDEATTPEPTPESPWSSDKLYMYAETRRVHINGANIMVYHGHSVNATKARKMHRLGIKVADAATGMLIEG